MRLFGLGGSAEDPAVAARREASEQSLRNGGLPLDAIERLQEQAARQGTPAHCFSSDLSVNELLLLAQEGLEPLGQVMGSSVYHVGWQYLPQSIWSAGELTVITHAFYDARRLALGRLQQEAAVLQASAVIGVRLTYKQYEWGEGMLEFAAVGTAVRERGKPADGAPPRLTSLSGQEFWALRRAGYRPVGVAVGNCTYYQVPNWRTRMATSGGIFGTGAWNQELPDYTRALYRARALAMSRMEHEAVAEGARGVVAVQLDLETEAREVDANNEHRTDLIFHFTAIGTAIALDHARPPLDITQTVTLA